MPSIELLVNHSVGLHARPAAEFVKTANKFQCEIMIRNLTTDGKFVNAKSILSVLTLGVNQGHKIFVEAEGEQAEEALTALNDLVNNNFGESTG
jgi:phosphotransferase system HPr (HPr) family protein